MSIESELKMLPREEINEEILLKLLKENGYTIEGEIKAKLQEDTYFDDKDETLSKNGCSFRIRRSGDKAVVTCKIPKESNKEYKQREEMEVEIPEQYIDENGNILLENAIKVLKQEYPDINLPNNLEFAIKVCNQRNKVNVKADNGTVIELAFDRLHTEDNLGILYDMKDEIECEVLSGSPENLENMYKIIISNYDIERNELSKYSRALKEMKEERRNMSLDEITICAMLADILQANEFNQMKFKGQMIHDYRTKISDNLNLDSLKNTQYLINKISEVKRSKNYKPGRIKDLEDMFLCFFSDMNYKDIEYRLVNFLNDNYYKEDTPITNRMLHSQQVMLITGLISRSKEISADEKNTLLCMASALIHDIGHVPGAHPTEEILGEIDGFFSHEVNGRNVIEKIISRDEEKIVDEISKYYASIGEICDKDKILLHIENNKLQMKKSIEAHSRTNSDRRAAGTVVQLPRAADKICYGTSDIVDIIKKQSKHENDNDNVVEFFPEKWKDRIVEKLGKGYEREAIIRQKIDAIEAMIRTRNFGNLTTSMANTVRENIRDEKTYYDVEQDLWDILDSIIKYVKDLRKDKVIDNKREKMQYGAGYFILKIFNRILKEHNGNVELSWDATIDEITNSNDLDILNSINELNQLFKNEPEKLKEAFLEGGILDISNLKKLDNSDRQIKMQPQGKFQMSDLMPSMGSEYIMSSPETIKDTYYYSGKEGLSICMREYEDNGKKSIIVKRKRGNTSVIQVEREKYVTASYEANSLEELVEKFNSEHKDLKIDVPNGAPKCVIKTIRSSAENEKGVIIRKDKSKIIYGSKEIEMPETIEIGCNDRKMLKKLKQQLSEFLNSQNIKMQEISTKQTKEEQAMRLIQDYLLGKDGK